MVEIGYRVLIGLRVTGGVEVGGVKVSTHRKVTKDTGSERRGDRSWVQQDTGTGTSE